MSKLLFTLVTLPDEVTGSRNDCLTQIPDSLMTTRSQ